MRFFRRGPKDELSARMQATADLFVKTAEEYGFSFDYSEGSVKQLDDWADRLWDPNGPPPGEAELDSNTKLMGAYLGEVIIRSLGGRWVWQDDPGQPAIALRTGQSALVLNRAYKRQTDGSSQSFWQFYAGARQLATG